MNKVLNSRFAAGFLIVFSIIGLFFVKHNVRNMDREITKINREILKEKEAIHVLNAEWVFLTQPSKISKLASKHLSLSSINIKEVKRISLHEGVRGD